MYLPSLFTSLGQAEYWVRYVTTVLGVCVAAIMVPGASVSRTDQSFAFALLTILIVAALFRLLSKGLLKLTKVPLTLVVKVLPQVWTVLLIIVWAFALDALLLWALAEGSDRLDLAFHLDGFWSVVLTGLVLAVCQLVATIILTKTLLQDAGPGSSPIADPGLPTT
jgi:putative membrane protein